jgi:hypothetical protein
MSMLHNVHAAWPCPCCKSMSILHVRVRAACLWPCCMSVFMLHVHSMLDVRISMLHVHAACPSCLPMLHSMLHDHAAFNFLYSVHYCFYYAFLVLFSRRFGLFCIVNLLFRFKMKQAKQTPLFGFKI